MPRQKGSVSLLSFLSRLLLPHKEVIPLTASQTEIASPTTPLIILTGDPFTALSQAVKDGYSLVVTPLSIPSSATCRLDADLSSNEGSK